VRLPAWRIALAAALGLLAILFAAWFRDDARPLAALLVFAVPPLLLSAGVLRNGRVATFASGVFGLFWFCHGVMLAYDRVDERPYALAEVVLSLAIIVGASWPGLRARFGRRGRAD